MESPATEVEALHVAVGVGVVWVVTKDYKVRAEHLGPWPERRVYRGTVCVFRCGSDVA